jgi:hypothetical protein
MEKVWYLQYKSIDGLWYDSGAYDTFEHAKAMYERSGRKENYRVIERIDKVVWPTPVDPASMGGA